MKKYNKDIKIKASINAINEVGKILEMRAETFFFNGFFSFKSAEKNEKAEFNIINFEGDFKELAKDLKKFDGRWIEIGLRIIKKGERNKNEKIS